MVCCFEEKSTFTKTIFMTILSARDLFENCIIMFVCGPVAARFFFEVRKCGVRASLVNSENLTKIYTSEFRLRYSNRLNKDARWTSKCWVTRDAPVYAGAEAITKSDHESVMERWNKYGEQNQRSYAVVSTVGQRCRIFLNVSADKN
jgi:hypothetical protein